MARTLEERLAGPDPEPWQPEAGESIIGEIESITTRDGDYGEYPVVVLLDNDGLVWSVPIWGTVLQKKFNELAPVEGDRLGFKFLGEREPKKKGGKPYKDWQLLIQRVTPRTVVYNDPMLDPDFDNPDAE